MRCLECDYALWNLKARQCPECGSPFTPRSYEFLPNSVRFCCPHCEQPYYGTGATGLLEPDAFDCVQCGRHVTLDDMVLLPAEGLQDHQTKVGSNPWLERDRIGRFKGWWATIGQSMVSPNRLAQGTPETSSLGQAWWFTIVTFSVTFALSMIPALCIAAIPMLRGPPGQSPNTPPAGTIAAIMAGGVAGLIVFGFVFMLVYAWLWALVTHLLLRISGSGHGPLRTTVHSILYSSGTIVLSIIPCVGNLAVIWWLVSAVIMVKESHRVSGLRATFAVLTGPVVLILLFIAAYAVLIAAVFASASTTAVRLPPQARAQSALTVLEGLVEYAAANGDRGPAHALQLVVNPGLRESDFIDPHTATGIADVPVAGMDLQRLSLMEPDDRPAVIEQAAAALPANVIAHRVGDFVFTYHGVVLDGRAPRLWLFVISPDPDTIQFTDPETAVVAGRADGSLMQILPTQFPVWLEDQNRFRAEQGLPPLPDPSTVTHRSPAVGDPDDPYDPP
ncbi:MAG: Yip1 family protein [Vicinamibacterales bacterium]